MIRRAMALDAAPADVKHAPPVVRKARVDLLLLRIHREWAALFAAVYVAESAPRSHLPWLELGSETVPDATVP